MFDVTLDLMMVDLIVIFFYIWLKDGLLNLHKLAYHDSVKHKTFYNTL